MCCLLTQYPSLRTRLSPLLPEQTCCFSRLFRVSILQCFGPFQIGSSPSSGSSLLYLDVFFNQCHLAAKWQISSISLPYSCTRKEPLNKISKWILIRHARCVQRQCAVGGTNASVQIAKTDVESILPDDIECHANEQLWQSSYAYSLDM